MQGGKGVDGTMRAVVQRVGWARVSVEGRTVAEIEKGVLVLLGVRRGDGRDDARWLADKVCGLRIFGDEQGRMNLSVSDVGGAVLVVSQFTLYGDCRRGRRPSYTDAAPPEEASPLVDEFVRAVGESGIEVKTGVFGARMDVELRNCGPVTLVVDSP